MVNGCRWVALIRALLWLMTLSVTAVGHAQIDWQVDWESALYSNHPLVGRIWDSAANKFIDAGELMSAIERASYLLLGEKHDNPDHHQLQQTILGYLIAQNRVSNIAFEMMDSDAQGLLDDIQAQSLADLATLESYLRWDEEGWDWIFYGPLIRAAYVADIPMAAANINADTMQQVYAETSLLEISSVLDASTVRQLNLDIDESHCGLLPDSQFPAMVRVQRARDNAMAKSMQSPAANALSLLLAGNYHIRQDLGVPNYLLAQDSSVARNQIVSLSFMEVDPAQTEAIDYQPQFNEVQAFDYIWFTPVISDEDYCASLQ